MGLLSILPILPFCKELSKHIILFQISLILTGFLISSTGVWTNGIMELYRGLIKQRLRLNTVKIKFLFGEEVTMFLHHLSNLLMNVIQHFLKFINHYQQMLFQKQSHWRQQLIVSSHFGMIQSVLQFWSIKKLS